MGFFAYSRRIYCLFSYKKYSKLQYTRNTTVDSELNRLR